MELLGRGVNDNGVRNWPDVRVVDDHIVVCNSRGLVFLRDTTEGVEEQAVTEFHDVGLVDASNFLFRKMSGRQTVWW